MGVELSFNKEAVYTSLEELIESTVNNNSQLEISTEGRPPITAAPRSNDCVPCGNQQNNERQDVLYTRVIDKNNKAKWTFLLNTSCFDMHDKAAYGEFIANMTDVEVNDEVFIYGPTTSTLNAANILASVIITCKSKNITMSMPYIFNLGSYYLLSYAKKIVYSPYDLVVCRIDETWLGGGLRDSAAALNMYKESYAYVMERLKQYGLLKDNEIEHMTKSQGQVLCYGPDLLKRYKAFNERRK